MKIPKLVLSGRQEVIQQSEKKSILLKRHKEKRKTNKKKTGECKSGCRGVSPVSVLSLDLVDGDVQRPVGPLAHRQGLIDAELCRCHRLTLREGCQVEAKLLPVGAGLQEVTLLFHCIEMEGGSGGSGGRAVAEEQRESQMFKLINI